MDQSFYIILKGALIGVLVSAPMGPIGALCIQRTLNKGRWHGFATGFGAMISDVIYAIMVGMGMSYILNFISRNETVIQIIGSALLFGFGIMLFRSNPIKSFKQQRNNITTYTQDLITAFFITLSNPFIIFLYIALFARLNYYNDDFTLAQHILGFASIASGAMLWWFIVTFLFGKLRSRFNLRRLWVLNRVIASIVIAISLLGLAYSMFYEVKEQKQKLEKKVIEISTKLTN
ncbi:MAG: LysE family transporter [Bacteroidales bacterium]|nr:LysE family transporter [Bacteroidales bacterium]